MEQIRTAGSGAIERDQREALAKELLGVQTETVLLERKRASLTGSVPSEG